MKSGITVEEVKRQKQYLEQDILNKIKEFERETGCSVKSVNLICNQTINPHSPSEVCSLFVECWL